MNGSLRCCVQCVEARRGMRWDECDEWARESRARRAYEQHERPGYRDETSKNPGLRARRTQGQAGQRQQQQPAPTSKSHQPPRDRATNSLIDSGARMRNQRRPPDGVRLVSERAGGRRGGRAGEERTSEDKRAAAATTNEWLVCLSRALFRAQSFCLSLSLSRALSLVRSLAPLQHVNVRGLRDKLSYKPRFRKAVLRPWASARRRRSSVRRAALLPPAARHVAGQDL